MLRVTSAAFGFFLASVALVGCGDQQASTEPSSPTGTLAVQTETTGDGLDQDGYTVSLLPDRSRDIGLNDSVDFTDVSEGDHQLELRGVASNCDVKGENPISVSVRAGSTTTKQFSIACLGQDVIAFMSDSTDNAFDIALMNTDGTGFRALAPAEGRDVRPGWSPDGQRIVFESDRAGSNRRDLFATSLDGSNSVRLTTDPGLDTWPDWSPDGNWIVFSTEMGDNRDIAIVRPDGSDLTNITQDSADNRRPHWSPDGEEIVFERIPLDGTRGVYSIKLDGSGLRKMTDGGQKPRWSPDGTKVVVVSGGRLVVITREDTTKTEILSSESNHAPRWSPDGEWIAFSRRGRDAQANDIFIIRPDGTGLRNLTDDPSNETQPSWSEDGERIAFTRERLDNRDIFVVDLDGNLSRLTEREGADAGPVWSRGRN